MKRTAFFACAAALWAAACADSSDPVSSTETGSAAKLTVSGRAASGVAEPARPARPIEKPDPATQAELRFDDPLLYRGLELTLLAVDDSRCPDGVVCVWEGEVAIELAATQDGEELDTVRLLLSSRDEAAARTGVGDYTVELVAVTPYPQEGVEPARADYVAALSLAPAKEKPVRRGRLTLSSTKAGGGPRTERPPVPLPENPFPPRPENKPLPPETIAAFEAARQRWAEAGLDNYDYQYQRQCFCLFDYVRPMAVQVRDGAVVSVVYADEEGGPVAEEIAADVPTIDGLFALLQEAVDENAASLQATYDESLGYPQEVFVDYDFRLADEEQGFIASKLEPVP